jgi:hypothetical protein
MGRKNFSIAGLFASLAWSASVAVPAFAPSRNASAPPQNAFSCGTPPALLQSLGKESAAASSASLTGALRVLVLRVSFKDKAWSGDTAAMSATHGRVAQFYHDNSYGAVSVAFRHHPVVLKTPETAQAYIDHWEAFPDFIWGKLRGLGLVKGRDFDRFVVNFPAVKLGWTGLSSGPSSGANYINGNYNSAVVAHELGHAMGLPHASAIEAGKRSVGSGNDSERVEYGDPFDVMGQGGILGHFNAWFKRRLGWISASESKDVGASGVFRLYAHDNPTKLGKLMALRLPSGNGAWSYWIEYRTSYSSTYVNTRRSAGVRMEDYFSGGKSAVVDMTPGSRVPEYDFNDADLDIGKDFRDPNGNFSLKTLAVNEGMWNQEGWVDVQVTWLKGGSSEKLPSAARHVLPGMGGAATALAVDASGRLIDISGARAHAAYFPWEAPGPSPSASRQTLSAFP